MKKLMIFLISLTTVQSIHSQISYGGGIVIEYNDFAIAPRVRISHNIGEKHQIDTEIQYFFTGKFWMFNVNYQRRLVRFNDNHQLRWVGGVNLFQAQGFKIQSVKYRGSTLYGINVGLEYDFKLINQEFIFQPKYIAGFGYRDIELALGVMLRK